MEFTLQKIGSQKSTMVEFDSNVIQRAKLNQLDCQNLRAAEEYHS